MGSTGSQHILRTPRRYCNSMEVTATIARFFGARSVLRRIALLTLAIWCVLAAFPALPPQTRLGLDPSWVLGINLAHAQGLEMGRDLVWPYGPLAYLSIPNPAGQHMWLAFLYRLLVYAVVCLAFTLPPRRLDRHALGRGGRDGSVFYGRSSGGRGPESRVGDPTGPIPLEID